VRPHPWARAHERRERAQAHRLQDLLRDDDFAGAIAVRLGSQRDSDRVADALLQQHGERRRRRDDPLAPHAGLGEAQMKRIVAATRELGVDGDQVLHVRDLAREDDVVARKAQSLGELCAANRRADERLAHHVRRVERIARTRVLVHQARKQVLVEASPVDADAHGLSVVDRALDHDCELRVVPGALPDIAGVYPVLRERAGAIGKLDRSLWPL
jgi:hypothetical protein